MDKPKSREVSIVFFTSIFQGLGILFVKSIYLKIIISAFLGIIGVFVGHWIYIALFQNKNTKSTIPFKEIIPFVIITPIILLAIIILLGLISYVIYMTFTFASEGNEFITFLDYIEFTISFLFSLLIFGGLIIIGFIMYFESLFNWFEKLFSEKERSYKIYLKLFFSILWLISTCLIFYKGFDFKISMNEIYRKEFLGWLFACFGIWGAINMMGEDN